MVTGSLRSRLAIVSVVVLVLAVPVAATLLLPHRTPGTASGGVVERAFQGAIGDIAAGGQVSCAIDATGTAYCAGNNTLGQGGNGSKTDLLTWTPVQGGPWASIDTGGATTCAIATTGALYCWGANSRGQLGQGTRGAEQTAPLQVGTDLDWKQVSVGWSSVCGVRTSGELYCWGGNDYGQLGTGDTAVRARPARVAGGITDWATVAMGGWHACATRVDGSAYCWGRNEFGQLGNGNTAQTSSPGPVAGGFAFGSVTATWSTSCGVTLAGGAKCWGLNDQGQFGNGTQANSGTPVDVSGGQTWASLDISNAHACGVDTTGTGWCWGSSYFGEIGTGATSSQSTPQRLPLTWSDIDAGWMHSCGMATDGSAHCWGDNERGQLGRGDTQAVRTVP